MLRRIVPADAGALSRIRSDADVNRYLNRPPQLTVAGAEKCIEKIRKGVKAKEWYYWAIAVKGADELIGTVCLWNIDKKRRRIELGYELEPASHGKGLMIEAAQAIIDFGFGKLAFRVITVITNRYNDSSLKLLDRLGFKNVGDEQSLKDDEICFVLIAPIGN
jgi:ribosomal-protein-alanine N-acetyltransferase